MSMKECIEMGQHGFSYLRANRLSHFWQTKGRSPAWSCACLFRWSLREKIIPQAKHGYDADENGSDGRFGLRASGAFMVAVLYGPFALYYG